MNQELAGLNFTVEAPPVDRDLDRYLHSSSPDVPIVGAIREGIQYTAVRSLDAQRSLRGAHAIWVLGNHSTGIENRTSISDNEQEVT
jgi:hypothetical protein